MKLDTAAATEPRFPCREVTPTYAAPIRHPHCPNGAARPLSHRHGSSSKWPFFRNTVQTRRLFRRPTPKSTGGAFRTCNEIRVRLRRHSTHHAAEGGAKLVPCTFSPHRSHAGARFDFGLAGFGISWLVGTATGADRNAPALLELEKIRLRSGLSRPARQLRHPFDNCHADADSRAPSRK